MRKFFTIDQAENDGEGAGGEGSQTESIEASAAAALAEGQAEPAKDEAAGPAGDTGKTSQAQAEEQHEINWNGKQIKMTRQELIDAAQRGYNVTQKEQEISKLKKDLLAKHARAAQLIEEAESRNQGEEDPEADTELGKVRKTMQQITEKLQLQEWEKTVSPIKAKYPDVDELELAAEFQKKVKAGEAENTAADLERIAGELAKQMGEKTNTKLQGALADEKNTLVVGHNQKVIEKFLANPADPRLAAYNQKVISDYVSGKTKFSNAGGDNGKGAGTGTGAKKEESIDEVAARLRRE